MARLKRRSNHDAQRGALNAAHRNGLSLEEWMEQVDGAVDAPTSGRRRSFDEHPAHDAEAASYKSGDIHDLSQRLESLSSRLDRISGAATGREAASRREMGGGRIRPTRPVEPSDETDEMYEPAPPRRNAVGGHRRPVSDSARPAIDQTQYDRPPLDRNPGGRGSVDRDRRTGSMLDILNTLDERVSAMADRIQGPDSRAGAMPDEPSSPTADGHLDVDLKSAVSEIARKQKQLDRSSGRQRPGRSAPRSAATDTAPATMPDFMEDRFSDLAARIDSLRNQPASGPIVDLRDEITALRAELAARPNGPHQDQDLADIQETVRNLEFSLVDGPQGSGMDDVRGEIAELRQAVESNSAHSEIASLRDGYENILHRLEGLQSTVGDPKLYHTIADRLSEVRKALRAIPQVEHASGLERRISALADQLETVGAQVSGLPLDTLQNQVFEIQGALQSIDPSSAIRDLDWKLRAVADKIDALEDGLSETSAVSNRVASLEDLIRSQPSAAAMAGRLDELHELLLEKNSSHAVRDLESRIVQIGEKLDFVGANTTPNDMLAAVDGRIADLCARFDTFSTNFDDFADTQNGDVLNPQIERIAERIETLAATLLDSKTMDPVRRDISDLRKELADGDRAVVDLAERIGRISDRLDRFTVFDGVDGKLGRLSDDLIQLQQQIADGDSVVFEILKRVGSLEKTLNRSGDGSQTDTNGVSAEIAEIRDRLASGDETLTNIANRMESLLSSVNVVASEPGLLSELEPVQNDFAALQSELSEGNRVARDVLSGLSAIDARLNNLAIERAENADIARLSEEIATLRDVVQATDNATISALNAQISSLAERLDHAPVQGAGDAVFHQLERQITQMADKLASTDSQLLNLASVSEKLDRLDDLLAESSRETVSATRQALGEFASAAHGSAADDPAVVALQTDLKRLQKSASKTDDSFGAVQDALTGIADRLSSLEGNTIPARQERKQPVAAPTPDPAFSEPEPARAPPAARREPVAARPEMNALDTGPDDNRPLEPGSGKPRLAVKKSKNDPRQAGPAATPQMPSQSDPRPGNRADFLAAARKAAKQAAAETGAKSVSDEKKPKQGWLAKAASLRNRKPSTDKEDDARQEPRMAVESPQTNRVSVLDDDIARASAGSNGSAAPSMDATPLRAEKPAANGGLKKHARTIVAAVLAIAVVLAGLQGIRTYLGGGLNVASITETDPEAAGATPETPKALATGPAADTTVLAPPAGDGSKTDPTLAFSPPSGLESTFDKETDAAALQPGTEQIAAPRQIPVTQDSSAQTRSAATAATAPTTESATNNLPDPEVGPLALRQAAAAGDTFAQFEIAGRYMEGRVVEQNLPKAVEWYSRAAGKGFAQAQYRLGSMFEKGLGIPKDLQSARSWYTRAADKGNAKAIHNLAVLHAEGGLGERNFNRSSQWFIQAANYGVTDSQYNLGILYAQGLGVERNMSESYKWFSLAAKAGDADAGRKRDAIAAELNEEQKSRARIAVSAWKPEPLDPAANDIPTIPSAWQGPGEGSKPVAAANQDPTASLSKALSPEALIGQVQKMLAERGYNPGPADGKMGPQTENAVKAFQRSAGLPVTGAINITLLNALNGEAI